MWQLLIEADDSKLTHLEHIEDLIINEGEAGALRALNYLKNVINLLTQAEPSGAKLTVKWDGAPSIVCGIDPEDGKFFVATKGAFAKEPKLVKSKRDAANYYGAQPELEAKMLQCLKYLSKLDIPNVMQGDLMFGEGDREVKEIGGQQCITFTPNTITYAIPLDSALGKRVAKAKLGIIFHTYYTGGPSIADMKANFGASVSGLHDTADVWVDDAIYKDYSNSQLSDTERASVEASIDIVEGMIKHIKQDMLDAFLGHPDVKATMKMWINKNIKEGQLYDLKTAAKDYQAYVIDREKKEIAKLKTGAEGKAGQARLKKMQDFTAELNTSMGIFNTVLRIHNEITKIKNIILRKLSGLESVGTFIKTDDGYKVTEPEGFVAIGVDDGAIKLVDRLTFSHQNFNAVKNWKKT
jgi:Family of unknown function (DUF6267)